jgi:hypothetical protein
MTCKVAAGWVSIPTVCHYLSQVESLRCEETYYVDGHGTSVVEARNRILLLCYRWSAMLSLGTADESTGTISFLFAAAAVEGVDVITKLTLY